MLLLVCVVAMAAATTGCVRTASGRTAGAVPLVRDSVEGRYERTVEQVYAAALQVMRSNGVINNELLLHDDQHGARAIEGRVNQRRVWIRVEAVDALVTSVIVQARTSAGGTDMRLANELQKQIAVQLAR